MSTKYYFKKLFDIFEHDYERMLVKCKLICEEYLGSSYSLHKLREISKDLQPHGSGKWFVIVQQENHFRVDIICIEEGYYVSLSFFYPMPDHIKDLLGPGSLAFL